MKKTAVPVVCAGCSSRGLTSREGSRMSTPRDLSGEIRHVGLDFEKAIENGNFDYLEKASEVFERIPSDHDWKVQLLTGVFRNLHLKKKDVKLRKFLDNPVFQPRFQDASSIFSQAWTAYIESLINDIQTAIVARNFQNAMREYYLLLKYLSYNQAVRVFKAVLSRLHDEEKYEIIDQFTLSTDAKAVLKDHNSALSQAYSSFTMSTYGLQTGTATERRSSIGSPRSPKRGRRYDQN